MKNNNNYVFIFYYEGGWMISIYANGRDDEYFNSAEDYLIDALDYVNLFLKDGGNKYVYNLPDYDLIEDMDIFALKNEPIEKLASYLNTKESILNEKIQKMVTSINNSTEEQDTLRDGIHRYILELDVEIKNCQKLLEQNMTKGNTSVANMMAARVQALNEVSCTLKGLLKEE